MYYPYEIRIRIVVFQITATLLYQLSSKFIIHSTIRWIEEFLRLELKFAAFYRRILH